MTSGAGPRVKHLVLVGGGHSHVEVLRSLGVKPMPGVRITLVAREERTPYSGMLPGFIAGHYGFDDIHIDLSPLARAAGARLLRHEAIGLDLDSKQVLCRDRAPVPYDVLSINTGSTPRPDDVPGAMEHVVPVKPIGQFITRWRSLCRRLAAADGARLRIIVVGAGAGGVEVLLSVQHRLGRLLVEGGRDRPPPEFFLITASNHILPSHNAATQKAFARILGGRGVQVRTGHRVVEVVPGRIRCANAASLPFDEILWVTPGRPAGWIVRSALATDPDGFIRTDKTLQSISHPHVFAAGDIASMDGEPRPKAGVFAVRHGPPLTDNLRRALQDRPLRPFTPQTSFLTLISTGDRYAVGARGGWAVEGKWVWRWKDRIDRAFMRRYARPTD